MKEDKSFLRSIKLQIKIEIRIKIKMLLSRNKHFKVFKKLILNNIKSGLVHFIAIFI